MKKPWGKYKIRSERGEVRERCTEKERESAMSSDEADNGIENLKRVK